MVLDVLRDDWVERVVQCAVQVFVVQNQRVGFEDLSEKRGDVRDRKCAAKGHIRQ